jgi:hypothetical protein
MTLEGPIEPKYVEPFVRRKAALQEEIETLPHDLETLKASEALNATETIFPRTNLRLVLKLGTS